MSENTKANKQNGPPVVINIKMTPTGYQLINEKGATTISLTKSMLTKTGKSASKGSVSKTTSKGAETSTPGTAQKTANLSKSKSSIKPPTAGGNKASTPAGSQVTTREKAPAMVQEVEVKRREIFPFTDFTMGADGGFDIPETSIPIDLAVSIELTKPEKAPDSVGGPAASSLKVGEKAKKMFPLVVPSSAHWFKFEEIHLIEKTELPDFFMGKPSKTPETYKKYRNSIIDLYRQNPKLYLNSTKCRKSVGGDACAIMKIHAFLERWGVINFSVNPKRMQNLNLSKADKIGDKILVFSKSENKFDMFDQERRLAQKRGEEDELFNKIRVLTKKYRPLCDYCGMICGLVWYQQKSPAQYQQFALGDPNKPATSSENPNPGSTPTQAAAPIVIPSLRKKEMILCIKCFTDGNIPILLSHSDFAKVDVISKLDSSTDNSQAALWTEEENLQLLELIEKHADDWDEIQKVIPHRTHEEIIMHYLELPLHNVTSINISEAHEDEDEQPDLAKKELETLYPSFSEYANPILQHVAIFGSLLEKFRPKNRGCDQVKNEQESSTKEKMEAEVVGVKDEGDKATTIEIEDSKEKRSLVTEEEKKSLKKDLNENDRSLVINDAEFDFDKIEQERATYGRYGDNLGQSDSNLRNSTGRARKREDSRQREAANTLVDLQINKLESKLNFLDEYEKIMWQERRHQEVFQKVMIAERVALAHKRIELMRQEHSNNQNSYENKDPTTMLNFESQPSNMNVDDMISLGNNEKADEYPKDSF